MINIIHTQYSYNTQKLKKLHQVLLGQVGVLLSVSFYDLDEFLEVGLIPRHPGVDVGDDSCERALGLVTHINTRMTRNETSFQELVQVVEAHRKKYSNLTKKDLMKFF